MVKPESLSRRSFLKGAALLAASVPAAAFLSACGAPAQTAANEEAVENAAIDAGESVEAAADNAAIQDQAQTQAQAPAALEGPVLVVYYSATGNTERVAAQIAQDTGADTFALTPAQSYTREDLNYNNDDSRVSREHDDPSLRTVELVSTAVPDFDSYKTVFIGYPIWWGIAAWPVDGFVEANDFTGKTVIPFATSASSALGESGTQLAALAGTGTWEEGHRFSSSASDADIQAWVDSLQ